MSAYDGQAVVICESLFLCCQSPLTHWTCMDEHGDRANIHRPTYIHARVCRGSKAKTPVHTASIGTRPASSCANEALCFKPFQPSSAIFAGTVGGQTSCAEGKQDKGGQWSPFFIIWPGHILSGFARLTVLAIQLPSGLLVRPSSIASRVAWPLAIHPGLALIYGYMQAGLSSHPSFHPPLLCCTTFQTAQSCSCCIHCAKKPR